MPLRMKFMIVFCLLITIPFMVSGTMTYLKYAGDVERQAERSTRQIVEQIQINLDRYVKEMERLTLTPLYDEGILDILKNHSGAYQAQQYLSTDEQLKMNLFISSLSFERSEIEGIFLLAWDGSLFSNLEYSVFQSWDRERERSWMAEVQAEDGGLRILAPHEAAYYKNPNPRVVSLARLIREPFTHRPLGIVKVDLQQGGFEKIFSAVRFSPNSRLFIAGQDGRILYPNTGELQQQRIQEAVDWNDGRYLTAAVDSESTGLKVIAQLPRQDLRRDAQELISYTLLISVLSLIGAYGLAVVSSNRLVKPISHLQSKMKMVQKGAFKERAAVTTSDEIGQLTEVFNTMVGEIDRLVKEVYETRLREREAELSALQSQINPHFLYNTLESINMLAVRHNHPELSRVVTSLGKLLRYTVDKQERPVQLQEELLFVESYLSIQAFRLGEQLTYEDQVEMSLQEALVPRLILQPLVENVIEHAIGGAPVTVVLRAQVEEDDLLLHVEDNGTGISAAALERLWGEWSGAAVPLRARMEFGSRPKGYALRNVHQRLRLLYGEAYGLTARQREGGGSVFTVRLPFRWEDEDVYDSAR